MRYTNGLIWRMSMNERMKELLAQSTDHILGVPVVNQKRFAELIVRECAEVVKWTPSMVPNDTIIKNIKEHFGVE
jgi:hypothetical protein